MQERYLIIISCDVCTKNTRYSYTFCRFRVELELNYAKTMSKLSAKLMKVAQKGVGSIQNAWLMIGKEMEADSQAHRCIANSLEDEIVKPLKNLQETHCRIKKTVECDVSKTSECI